MKNILKIPLKRRNVEMCHWARPRPTQPALSKCWLLCQESHEVPEQVQHNCIDDDDMILKSTGQTAYDAAQKHRHWYGD